MTTCFTLNSFHAIVFLKMEQRLSQQQTQKLILSPQIRQYLRLLQMPVTELSQAMDQELTENPLLEEKQESPSEDSWETSSGEDEQPADNRETQELQLGESFDRLSKLEDEYGDAQFSSYDVNNASDLQKKKDYRESLVTRPEALSDYLIWQIRFFDLPEKDFKIAEYIIGNIDDRGYLQTSVEDIAQSLQTPPAKALEVLERIHQLEPPGVGARNLQEALVLQLKRQSPPDLLAIKIVQEHLPLLEKRDWAQIARVLNIDIEEVKKAAARIIRLEPRPGRSFYSEEPIAIVPDAVVTYDEETERFVIEITYEKTPSIRINPYYRRLIRDTKLDTKSREFLKNKLQDALNFMKAVKQRRSTLYEITSALVREQRPFFEKGFAYLKPLRLKDIAQDIGIHESTVSRAIQGKYIQTPQGTVPYRSFFSSKLETQSGEAESQKSIMEKIRFLIASESPQKPLSDQELVERLQKEGIRIARRTVAKYRELLRILPSHLRRKR